VLILQSPRYEAGEIIPTIGNLPQATFKVISKTPGNPDYGLFGYANLRPADIEESACECPTIPRAIISRDPLG
jgi:hypothetical protein